MLCLHPIPLVLLLSFGLLFLIGCGEAEPTNDLASNSDIPQKRQEKVEVSSLSQSEVDGLIEQALQSEADPSAVRNALNEALQGDNFLATDYQPLSLWFDEKFEVRYRHLTPEIVFDQVPLNDIHYEIESLPENASGFSFESPAVSRRDLLEKIAQHWNLELSLSISEDGNPSAVKVSFKDD